MCSWRWADWAKDSGYTLYFRITISFAHLLYNRQFVVGGPAIYVVVYECHALDWALPLAKQGMNYSDELQQSEGL